MGKAKSAKKGRQLLNNEPTPKPGSNSVNALEADLASLEEAKRHKACMLLADLYAFNISNKFSLDTLTSANILSKLSMRLVDTSDKVRVEGASALKNLSECKDSSIIKKLINLGVVRSAVTLCVEALTGGALSNPETVCFAENLLHTLANAISGNSATINEITSTHAEFISGLFSMINTNAPADIISAAANLLIIITTNCNAALVTGGDPTSAVFRSRMEQIWTFIESLNAMKSAASQEIAQLAMFSVTPVVTPQSKHAGITTTEEAREQRIFQINVLMIECLEVVVSVYTSARHVPGLAEGCRLNRALLLLNLELHTSLNGIEVARPAEADRKERRNSTVSMDTEAESVADGASVDGKHAGPQPGVPMDPVALGNMKRLGLCKNLAGVLSSMLESLTGETDTSGPSSSNSNGSTTSTGAAQERRQKCVEVGHLILEQQTCATLIQCYNAAFYFVSTSTAPGPAPAQSGSEGAPAAATTAIAITPAVIDGFDCCDQLAGTLAQVFTLLVSVNPAQIRESSLVDVPLFMQLLQPLLDLVTLTSPVSDNGSAAWNAPYFVDQGVTENAFRRSLLSAASSLIDFLALAAKHSTVHAAAPGDAAVVLTEEQAKALAVLLVKGSGYPNVEIAVPSALGMSALGQRDFAIREASGNQAGLLSPVLNALLTNALLRRLQDANAYSCDTAQQDKQLRLLEGGMQLMDSCFNAIIDLHTSDDTAFLSNYVKLQCAGKLQERGEFFTSKLGSTAAAKLDRSDLEKFSETLENLESFIQYKAGFTK